MPDTDGPGIDFILARALSLLEREKAAQALPLFRSLKKRFPGDPTVDQMIFAAEIAEAFDEKDYDKFLSMSKTRMATRPNDAVTVAGVASALACKYAVSGNEELKKEALVYLEKAQQIGGKDPNFQEYEDRIHHRLQTREIISRNEYKRRFPNGWKPGGKP